MDKDSIKEKIGFLKLWLTFFVTMDASSVAWFINNLGRVQLFKLRLAVLAIFILTPIIIFINNKTYKLIKNIGVK
jgi:hypothetical protein